MADEKKASDKTLGQRQGNMPEGIVPTRPDQPGVGQPGQANPDQPATQGVDHAKPKQD